MDLEYQWFAVDYIDTDGYRGLYLFFNFAKALRFSIAVHGVPNVQLLDTASIARWFENARRGDFAMSPAGVPIITPRRLDILCDERDGGFDGYTSTGVGSGTGAELV